MISDKPVYRNGISFRIIRKFYNESEATLYKIRLEDQGISCFISNAISSTILPFNDGGVILHVKDTDIEEALTIIENIDKETALPKDEDFKDADMGDIFYEKSRYDHEMRLEKSDKRELWIFYALIIAILIYVVLYFFITNK